VNDDVQQKGVYLSSLHRLLVCKRPMESGVAPASTDIKGSTFADTTFHFLSHLVRPFQIPFWRSGIPSPFVLPFQNSSKWHTALTTALTSSWVIVVQGGVAEIIRGESFVGNHGVYWGYVKLESMRWPAVEFVCIFIINKSRTMLQSRLIAFFGTSNAPI